MLPFILRRFAGMPVVLLCVIALTYILVDAMPGNPFTSERKLPEAIQAQLEAKYNMKGPVWQRLAIYLGVRADNSGHYSGLLQGDLGFSYKYRDRSVAELLGNTLPVSATLGIAAFLLATSGGIWLGSLAAVRHHTPADTGAMLVALFLISIPTFIIGPLLIYFFALRLGWLPVGGWISLSSIFLPAFTLACPYIAYIARLMRTSMLEVLGQDFIRTARAKGLNETRIVYRHALKVAVLPVVSYLGPLAANLLTGSLIVETIFNLPGAGPFFVNSILSKDNALLLGVVVVYCTLLVVLNFLVDIAYTLLDRRITLE